MTPRQSIEQQMTSELLTRRAALTAEKEQLAKAPGRILVINQTLAVIAEELAAYGYVEPAVVSADAQAVR